MKVRIGLAVVAALVLLISSSVVANTVAPVPDCDAGIRGYGTIRTANDRVGAFAINVIRRGDVVSGYFRYVEISPTDVSYDRRNFLFTKKIISLEVSGNWAKVVAEGVFNNQHARLTFEGLDDNPCGDWIEITATQDNSSHPWSVSGGVATGDICIWQKPPQAPYTKGMGVISIVRPETDRVRRHGVFRFHGTPALANSVTAYVGSLYFAEGIVYPVELANRRCVRVYVPRLAGVGISGNEAKMWGKGFFNGRPCHVEAVAVDYSMWFGPQLKPDWFEIRVFTEDTSTPAYIAYGPVIRGDIVVFPGTD